MSGPAGWLLDLYPTEKNEMTICVKGEGGDFYLLKEEYQPQVFVNGSPADLDRLSSKIGEDGRVESVEFEKRFVSPGDSERSRVLKIIFKSRENILDLSYQILDMGNYRDYSLYNVDVSPAQKFLHDREIFPLAKMKISDILNLDFDLTDSSSSVDYELPPFSILKMKVIPEKTGASSNFNAPIDRIVLSSGGEEELIEEGVEPDKILKLVERLKRRDPDIIMTDGGDSWDFPYLFERARANKVSDKLILGRESKPFEGADKEGFSYSSYGQTYYRSSPHLLRGRIHIDTQNSFIYDKCGLEGLVELARTTRTPLQETARSSIGSVMTNLQIFRAQEKDILIPWKKNEPEDFKTGEKLLEADKGGFIYEPELGFHENVGEVDFSSFYPTLMMKYNISPETISCDCCPNSDKRVPELDYRICEKQEGIIPQVLEPILEKRSVYKQLMDGESSEKDPVYESRQSALKWILVTCFGYLGYKNSKFGKIEAHEAVTAYAREKLRKASRIAEGKGFDIVHGIVDSLWVNKSDIDREKLEELCEEIEDRIGMQIGVEEEYSWIVFPPSTESPHLSVMNRYYGLPKGGDMVAKGIAAKRSDTPELVVEAQEKMLEKLARADDREEFLKMIPKSLKVIKRFGRKVREGSVDLEELVVSKKLSKDPDSYDGNVRTVLAADQLEEAGVELRAGQQVKYVVTDTDAKYPRNRVKPIQLAGEKVYDEDWYIDRLVKSAEELLNPFSYDRDRIKRIVEGVSQRRLD